MTVGVVPNVDPDTAIEQNTELAAYLATELDVETELRTAPDDLVITIQRLQYGKRSTAILAVFALVVTSDWLGSQLRTRLG
ncbi:hypothetical protein [Haloarcula sp. CBA1127]|uniref:hypothetical protein n=1 Tax=Haloarcula sp. CBA1127 TaxID=1765055 RepID=UPI00073F8AD1|nr:hypothetical protein [Haloarcula sp. CBA1127]